jgi:hypothetical protein
MTIDIENTVYAEPETPEPVLAGTLCRMTLYRKSGNPELAQKITHNLTMLSTRPEFSESFRQVCHRLREDWCQTCGAGNVVQGMPHVPANHRLH